MIKVKSSGDGSKIYLENLDP